MSNHLEIADRNRPHLSDFVTNPSSRFFCAARYVSRMLLPLVVTVVALSSAPGCASLRLNPDPEVAPSSTADRAWAPPSSLRNADDGVSKLERLRRFDDTEVRQMSVNGVYELPALIDLALKTNPQTRGAWYAALKANAQLGQSQASNYPKIQADAEGGYLKLPIQFPGQTLVIRNEAFLPQIKVSYDLLDFGRTRASERGAREQLIAANFGFDQAVQDLIFNVEKAYYVLAAAGASVNAAEANLTLARTSLDSVQQRHSAGLGTKPQILIAKQLEAEAVYDLENAHSMVHDAEAGLRQAVGLTPDADIQIRNDHMDKIPQDLGSDVETLMADALKKRPDLAAQSAAVRAGDAAVDFARSEFYPKVELSGNYGQVIWSYTVNGGHTQNLNQPFYGALVALRWDLFTGFDHYYGVQKATAERDATRSQLKALQLNAAAAVWKAYYDFASAKKKYGASEELVAASQESYTSNLESHRHGLATITDLTGAERDLMRARYLLVQNKAEFLISSCDLTHAIGAEN
jgi:outer membrane protein